MHPEQITQTTVVERGVEKNVTQKKRVLKTKKDGKKEITKIITKKVTVTPEEEESTTELPEELPMEIQETVVIDNDVAKKRTLRKEKDGKQQITEIKPAIEVTVVEGVVRKVMKKRILKKKK